MTNEWLFTPFSLDASAPAVKQLARPGAFVNTATPTGTDLLARMAAIHAPLALEVERIAAARGRPVSVGGDCCAAIAVAAGLRRAGIEPMVIWLDAHGDFNTHESTLTGFVGGMPLAMMTGRGNQSLLEADRLVPLPDTDVLLADARDLDGPERELLDRSKVVRTSDFESLVERTNGRPFYVHFDVDVLDPAEAPAMQYSVPGGAGVERLRSVAQRLHETGRLVAASMTPWAIERDSDGRTAAACWRVFHALVGEG